MLRSNRKTSLLTSMAIALLVISCGGGGGGGDGGTPPSTTTIAKAASNSGDAQNGSVGQPLGSPLQVVVTKDGAPEPGATVAWTISTGGGSVDPASAITGADGTASTNWSLGTTAGTQSARAALTGASGSPVTFTAAAAPGPAATLSKAPPDGDNQTGVVNSVLAAPVQAKVSDEFGNGVAGFPVIWSASGGAVSAASVNSNASGVAPVTVTLGAADGLVIITASADGLTGSPLTFNATATTAPVVPTTAAVTVGNNFFRSGLNTTVNPAVDTVAVGGTVTWTWSGTGLTPHSVLSSGSPSFPSSALLTGNGQTYEATFPTAGSYQYTCVEHPGQMTGRVVVR
jgi:plastocyanin